MTAVSFALDGLTSSFNPIFALCTYSATNCEPGMLIEMCRYELLKWEELQLQKRRRPLRRELEWATIAREIALMNKPYSRQQ